MSNKILFLCQHGGAKSVIAATYFNALWSAATPVAAFDPATPVAGGEGQGATGVAPRKAATGVAALQRFTAVAAATEDPYDAVPEPVAKLLGIRDFTPRQVTPEDLESAARIITIGCSLERVDAERWDDVPAASEDLEGSAAAIRRHVEELAARLRG